MSVHSYLKKALILSLSLITSVYSTKPTFGSGVLSLQQIAFNPTCPSSRCWNVDVTYSLRPGALTNVPVNVLYLPKATSVCPTIRRSFDSKTPSTSQNIRRIDSKSLSTSENNRKLLTVTNVNTCSVDDYCHCNTFIGNNKCTCNTVTNTCSCNGWGCTITSLIMHHVCHAPDNSCTCSDLSLIHI